MHNVYLFYVQKVYKKMKSAGIYILVLNLFICVSFNSSKAQSFDTLFYSDATKPNQIIESLNQPPVAVNDTFVLFTGYGRNTITGNILTNDYDPDGNEIVLYFIVTPKIGKFTINNRGDFTLIIPENYLGTQRFEYYINEVSSKNYKAVAEVIIYVQTDYDCDNVSDEDDIDSDNDGILNIDEGNGSIDSDFDGIPDSFDIDSDNDGITDNIEWQKEEYFIPLSEKDINCNGWDDAYDNSEAVGGEYYKPVDTNNDGTPDYIDSDSDEDGIPDNIESCDINGDGIADINPLNCDSDKDGLDDAFDTVKSWAGSCNSAGSNSPLPDLNNNGIRDWRDVKNSIPGEDNFINPDNIFLYPNPAISEFAVQIPIFLEEQNVELFLFNLDGKLLIHEKITSIQNAINIQNLTSGIFIIQIKADNFTHSERLFISR